MISVENNIAVLGLPILLRLAQPHLTALLRTSDFEQTGEHTLDAERFTENAIVSEHMVQVSV